MDAQGALDSLLGRLTNVLVNEAQLVGGVRGDVEFIKDEMESINGFLLHLAEDSDGDHQLRAWMKQVMELAYASQNCIDLYVQSLGTGPRTVGLLGYARWIPHLLWTMPARRRIAVRIRELKARAHEVGERRLRYGVQAPAPRAPVGRDRSAAATVDDAGREQEEGARRRNIAEAEPPPRATDLSPAIVTKWLLKEDGGQRIKVIAIVDPEDVDHEEGLSRLNALAMAVYHHPLLANSFDNKAWVCVKQERAKSPALLFGGILEQLLARTTTDEKKKIAAIRFLGILATFLGIIAKIISPIFRFKKKRDISEMDAEELVEKLREHLKGKRSLIVLEDVPYMDKTPWDLLESAFGDDGGTVSSPPAGASNCAIIVTTRSNQVATSLSPCEILEPGNYRFFFFLDKATALLQEATTSSRTIDLEPVLRSILTKLVIGEGVVPFIDALRFNAHRTKEELESLCDGLDDSSQNHVKQVRLFHINGLPRTCKSCLLHLGVFPQGAIVTRRDSVTRWVAQGVVAKRGRMGSAADEAERCFDMLVAEGFLERAHVGVTGKVKKCTLPNLVHDLITRMTRDGSYFVETSLLPNSLAHRLSFRRGIQQQEIVNKLHAAAAARQPNNSYWNICCSHFLSQQTSTENDPFSRIETFLDSVPGLSLLGLLVVLDLEGCKGLKKRHLKNICKGGFHLKYLSLRNTDVAQLPKQLDKLQYLETLDIRQTQVRAFATETTVLPRLNHLLAGSGCTGEDATESVFTVRMPQLVRMTRLQVLSHVGISHGANELIDVGKPPQLKKLGVVLGRPGDPLRHLYHAIGNLDKCLRSLSIRVQQVTVEEDEDHMVGTPVPPKYLRSLKISGLTNGLPPWADKLGELAKIALHKTPLKEDDMLLLGRLASLSCIILQHTSYDQTKLTFRKDQFQTLKFLVIKGPEITDINFDAGATPKLKKIVWSSTGMQSLSGIEHLSSLEELELNGGFDLNQVQQAIAANKNNPIFRYNQLINCQ